MAYTINRYNGTVLTSVENGTLNQITEIKFVGKNFAGYGETQNENLLHLLENFASALPPSKPISGMLWYDTSTNKVKFYDGARWRTTGGAEATPTAPEGLSEGDIWWNSATNQLYAKNASDEWVLVGPQVAGSGITQMRSLQVRDSSAVEHAIIAATIEDTVVFIVSPTEFTISNEDSIEGFDQIKKGVTLVDTTLSTNGITSSDFRYWGTASNSLRLNGKLSSDFISKDDINFTDVAYFGDAGFVIGIDNDILFRIDTDSETPFLKLFRNRLRFRDADNNIVFNITNTGLEPGVDNVYEIGKSNLRWKTIHAATFSGTATQSNTLKLDSIFASASVNIVPNTIVARDNLGNINANLFQGTATSAQYADLAEKYTTEREWPIGTAMTICTHSEHEACPANSSSMPIGVISENPAYLMNSNCDGQAIGLKGRLPVRVVGTVKKGQPVYAWKDGVCSTIATSSCIGIALETSNDESEKLIECVLKV